MILVADSGSTKCDWVFTDGDSQRLSFHTMGFNPFFHPTDLIESEIVTHHFLLELVEKKSQEM